MYTVQHVVTNARDRHRAFTPQQTPDAVLVRAISEYHQQLVSKVLGINPSLIVAELEIPLPLPDFAGGVAVPDHHYVHGGSVHVDEDAYTLTLVSPELRHGPLPGWPAAYIEGGRLFLADRASTWTWYQRIVLRYAGVPPVLTKLSDTFALPASCFPALVARAAAVMAARGTSDPDAPSIDRGGFAGDLLEAESTFLAEIGNRKRAITMTIRDVY